MSVTVLSRVANKLLKLINLRQPSLQIEKNFLDLIFHRRKLLSATATVSNAQSQDVLDTELVGRIITAYQFANKADLGDSMWKAFFSAYHTPIHQELMDGNLENVIAIFRNPGASDLFFGFDILTKSYMWAFNTKSVQDAYAKLCLDGLVRFAESTGASPIDNPETWSTDEGRILEAEELLTAISNECWQFSVPNPFPGEPGLKTSRGIVSYRTPQSLYQAWRIKQLVNGMDSPRILEIGAGLGRTAYYAYELGLTDYSIVDIPVSSASQAYFLGRTLGENKIHLDGEQSQELSQKIKILTPRTFLNETKSYDLILNADSLTEMDLFTAKAYWDKIKTSTNTFLSINHESNTFRVQDLFADDLPNISVKRHPYWMRRGYVEELINVNPQN